MKFPIPTEEQWNIWHVFQQGHNLVVESLAGVGKTTLLAMMSHADTRKGVNIVFNKSTAIDAQTKFNSRTHCTTGHALAYKAVGYQYAHRLGYVRISTDTIMRVLGIEHNINLSEDRPVIKKQQIARLAMETVQKFCNSDSDYITEQHVPFIKGLEKLEQAYVSQFIVQFAWRAWADLINYNGVLKFSHDVYFKLYSLSKPVLNYDYIMLDEAQDCQPEGTLVWTPLGYKKIETLKKGDVVYTYNRKSLRIPDRGCSIVSTYRKEFKGNLIQITTVNNLVSSYAPEHICIIKIDKAFDDKFLVYLMRRGNNFRVGVTIKTHGKTNLCSGVTGRLREEKADCIWILKMFDNRKDALMEESKISSLYGIPQLRFVDNGQKSVGQDRLDKFWFDFNDLTEKAAYCLEKYGRKIEYPLVNRAFTDEGNRSAYLLYTRASLVRACNLMDGMCVIEASSLMRNHEIKHTKDDEKVWLSFRVDYKYYEGYIYSLEVHSDRTYIADGIVTHNCNPALASIVKAQQCQLILIGDANQSLYTWRGSVDAMSGFSGTRLALTECWRFGERIAAEGNKWLELLQSPLRLKGKGAQSFLDELDRPAAVLCRTNAQCVAEAANLSLAGVSVAIVGGADEVRKMAEAAALLKQNMPTSHPDLFLFKTWKEVQEYIETPDGKDLKTFVKLIDNYGPAGIVRIIDRLVEENEAQTLVSTTHKFKGREAATVRISTDFPEQVKEKPLDRPEAMLAYVAVTRAKEILDNTSLAWVNNWFKQDDNDNTFENIIDNERRELNGILTYK